MTTAARELILAAARPWLDEAGRRQLAERLAGLAADLPWGWFLETVGAFKLAGTVWWNLRAAAYDIPIVPRQYLQAFFLYHRQRNALLADESGSLAAAFADAGLPAVFRKGAYLAFHRYPDPGMRTMNDIDVLIRREHAGEAVDLLRRLGYATGRLGAGDRVVSPLPREQEAFFRLYTNNLPPMKRMVASPYAASIMVDLVTGLFLPATGYTVDAGDVIGRAVPAVLGGTPACVPAPVDFLLDLCAHTFKESTTVRFLRRGGHRRLVQHSDIQALLRHPTGSGFDWAAFTSAARQYEVAGPCYYTLGQHARLYPDTVPADVLAMLAGYAGKDGSFLDEYGHVDLPQPRRWPWDLPTRLFSGDLPADLPATRSLV